jgi:hypothetical protein
MKYEQVPGLGADKPPSYRSERREDFRHLTIYRVAKILRAEDAGLWRVKNMSDRGMLFATDAAITPNEKLEIVLSETIILSGRVVWSGDGQCGVLFDQPICAGETLRQLVAEREAKDYRPLRLEVRCPAKLLIEAEERTIVVTSISQFGVGFACEDGLQEGARVDLALADNGWRRGNIRWIRDGVAGLCLASPFALSELESVRSFGCDVIGLAGRDAVEE